MRCHNNRHEITTARSASLYGLCRLCGSREVELIVTFIIIWDRTIEYFSILLIIKISFSCLVETYLQHFIFAIFCNICITKVLYKWPNKIDDINRLKGWHIFIVAIKYWAHSVTNIGHSGKLTNLIFSLTLSHFQHRCPDLVYSALLAEWTPRTSCRSSQSLTRTGSTSLRKPLFNIFNFFW